MWGGRKIATVLGKSIPNKPIGESWELFDFPPGVVDQSKDWISAPLSNGPLAGKTLHELLLKFGKEICGKAALVGPHGQFPLLIKFLDANQDLSVQVHPDETYAAANPGAHLKNEAWYVVQADAGSRILSGLKKEATRETLSNAISLGTVESWIQSIVVEPGDCFYLASGTVHALGAGILAAEVQTPSDTTFRVYDFDRIEPSTGKKRALHVEQAMQCIHFADLPETLPTAAAGDLYPASDTLVRCESFYLAKTRLPKGAKEPIPSGEPVVWMMLEGTSRLTTINGELVEANRGETILLPASMKNYSIEAKSDCVWLEVKIPAST